MTQAELVTFFQSYSAAWKSNSAQRLLEHWDPSETSPFYKAEEISRFYHTYDEILSYWQHNENFHDAVELEFSDIKEKSLTDSVSMVFLRMQWDIKFAPGTQTQEGLAFAHAGKRMGGENHVLALLRHIKHETKLIGWSETPDAPITYMGRLYEWAAARRRT